MSQPDVVPRFPRLLLRQRHLEGPLLLLASAVAFSTAGVFARSVPVDAVTMLFWRNLFGGVLLLPFVFRHGRRPRLVWGPKPIAIVVLTAFGSICYIAAFSFTSVANISIIYGAAPLLTAVLAWSVLRECLPGRTWVAALVALAGVALTTLGNDHGSGASVGDGLAVLMTLALSAVAVLSRGQALPPVTISCASSILAALAIAPARPTIVLNSSDFLWLAAFGVVTMAVALPCYLLSLRSVPAGRAMLVTALELPLGPFWVWAAFGEKPTTSAAVGGTIVCAAIAWELLSRPR